MVNKRFRYHPYLGEHYLRRNVGNFCLKCGKKMGNIRPDLKTANQMWFIPYSVPKPILIGHCHYPKCPSDNDDFLNDNPKIKN